jgi:hypothetical protein
MTAQRSLGGPTVGVDGLPLICLGTRGVECLLICIRVRGRHIGGAAPVLVFVEDVFAEG